MRGYCLRIRIAKSFALCARKGVELSVKSVELLVLKGIAILID